MANPVDEATATMIANLKTKTGKSLDQWAAIAAKSGKSKHGEIVSYLKSAHELGHGYANLVAHTLLKSDAGSISQTTDLVAAAFAGDKAALKPIYDAIIKTLDGFGPFEIAPKKGYVSLRRAKQFALAQPSTKTRLDLGLQLKGEPARGRLEAAGSWNAMVSHRVRLEAMKDFDAEARAWLKQAYDNA